MIKKKQEQFDTYRSRMKKIKEVTIKASRTLLFQVQDAYSWFCIKNKAEEAEFAGALVAKLKKYDETLSSSEITLGQINSTNKAIDLAVKRIQKAVAGKEAVLERTLEKGMNERIKDSGYSELFDEQAMYDLERQHVVNGCEALKKQVERKRMERLANEGKALKAMFNGYSEMQVREMRIAMEGEAE